MTDRVQILGIKLDADGALKELTDIGLQLRDVAAHKRDIEKLYKEGKVTETDYVRRLAEIKAATTDLTQRQAGYQRQLAANQRLTQQQTGSLEEMRAELSGLTAAYGKLSKEERENVEIGGKMQARMKALSDELKEIEKGYGNTARNVGNYSEGLKQAIAESGFLSGVTAKLNEVQETFIKMQNISKAAMMGNVSVLKLLKLAMASTGIGLLVLALGGLVSYLTKTQEGIDWVNQKTKGLQTVFAVLTDKLSAVGEAIFKAFDNPKQAVKDLINLIQTNLINRAKAFMIIWDAIKNADQKKLRDGLLQLGTGVEDVVGKTKKLAAELNEVRKTAEAIEKENQRIRDAERALNVERSKSRALIKELNMIAEDTNKTTAERAAAARKALQIELGLDEKRRTLQQQRIDNIKAEQALTNNLTADNDALAEQEQKLGEMAAESLELRTTLQNKLNSILKEGEAARLKAFEEDRKRRLEMAKELKELNSRDMLAAEVNNTDKILEEARRRVEGQLAAIKEEAAAREWLANHQAELLRTEQEMADKSIALAYAVTDTIMVNVDKQSQAYKVALKAKQAVAVIEASMALPGIFATNMEAGGKISAIAPPVTVPLGVAYTVAADALAVAKVAMLISQLRNTKVDSFYQGGYTTSGNPYEEANNLGAKPYVYHKSEYVAPARVLATPEGAYHVRQLEMLRTGKSFYSGGYTIPGPTRSALAGNGVIDYRQMAAELGNQIAKIKVVTQFQDYKAAEQKHNHVQNRVNA